MRHKQHNASNLRMFLPSLYRAIKQTTAFYSWEQVILPKVQSFGDPKMEVARSAMNNAAMESSLINIRALNEFFEKGGREEDMRAHHFPGNFSKGPFLSPSKKERIHKLLAHLTTRRLEGDSMSWDLFGYMIDALKRALEFLQHLNNHFAEMTPQERHANSGMMNTTSMFITIIERVSRDRGAAPTEGDFEFIRALRKSVGSISNRRMEPTRKKTRGAAVDFGSIDDIRAAGFEGFKTTKDLRVSDCEEVPEVGGVYFVICDPANPPRFASTSRGGRFKGRNPTVPVTTLQENWVDGAAVLYIGKAGGTASGVTLRKRIRSFMKFGAGHPVSHWGGRLIWQLEDCEDLAVCWKRSGDSEPAELEADLIEEFSRAYRRRPFANLRD